MTKKTPKFKFSVFKTSIMLLAIPVFMLITYADIKLKFYAHLPAILILGLGLILNSLVLCFNGFRMPVFHGKVNTKVHFPYKDKTKVSLWFLTDWLYLIIPDVSDARKQRVLVFSIGDTLLFIGIILNIYCLFLI